MEFGQTGVAECTRQCNLIRYVSWVCLVVLVGVTGCTGGEFDAGRAGLLAQAAASRAVWEDAAIANYEYVYKRSCFCGSDFVRPLRIQVRSGIVTSVVFADTGVAVTDTALGPFPTIDGIFEDLQARILEADNVNAEFDQQRGFPTQYIVDLQATYSDDEYSITITEFREL